MVIGKKMDIAFAEHGIVHELHPNPETAAVVFAEASTELKTLCARDALF